MAIVKIPVLDATNTVREFAFAETPDGLMAVHELFGAVSVPGVATEATTAAVQAAVEAQAAGTVADPVHVSGLDGVATQATVAAVLAAVGLLGSEATAAATKAAVEAQARGTAVDPTYARNVPGSIVIGSKTFGLDGRVVTGKAADRPTAASAHAVVPWGYFVAADTGAVSQTDGTNWRTL